MKLSAIPRHDGHGNPHDTGSSGTPAGTVSFYNGGTALGNLLGTATLNGSGVTTFVTSFATAAIQNITATYNGNNTYAASNGTTIVTTAPNATATITTSANNVALNATPTYTATITGNAVLGTPVGTVQFAIFNTFTGKTTILGAPVNLLAGAGNTATAGVTSSALANPGSYLITVAFTPTGSNNPYAAFAVNTTSATNGIALIETVKQAFTPGNLVAVQRGDGTVNLGSSGYLTFLDEYTTAGGVLVQKIALPNVSSGNTNALLETGQSGAEGLLNRSANGYSLTIAGYDVPVGRTFVTSTFPYQYSRTIALVNGAATVDTSTTISTTSSSSIPYNPLDVISNDGKEFWLVSSLPIGDTTESGLEFVSSVGATSATQIGAANTAGTSLAIAGGQLYASSIDVTGGSAVGVYQVGTGLPTAPATLAPLPGLQAAYQANFPDAANPQQMLFFNHADGTTNNPDTLYIADLSNGLLKFALVGGVWTYEGEKLVFSGGASGVTGYVINPGPAAQVQLYVTGSNIPGANPNQVASFTDTNSYNTFFAGGNFSTVALVGATGTPASPNANMNFAGLAYVPAAQTNTMVTSSAASAPPGSNVTLTATVTSPVDNPNGTVTFMDGTTILGTDPITTVGIQQQATFTTTTPLSFGNHIISAVYNPGGSSLPLDGTSSGTTPVAIFNKYAVTILGGSSFVAGSSFLFTVQATDFAGNPLTNYNGPSTITINANPGDPLSNFPITTGTLNSSGFGFFLGTLKTVGSYTLTASAGTFTGTSSTITVIAASAVYFTVTAPTGATTGTPFNVTVTVYDLYKNVATGYTGTVKLTSTSASSLGGNYTFTTTGATPDNGTHTFSVTLNTGGSQTITATDTTATAPIVTGTSNPIITRGLTVSSLTPTPTGFTASFNKAFIPADVFLYNSVNTTTADVVMTGISDIVTFSNVSGTIKLTYNGSSSTLVPPTFGYNAGTTAALFQAYLATIPGLTAPGAVIVTGPVHGPFTVNFGPGVQGGSKLVVASGPAAFKNVGKISGTILIDPTKQSFTFKATTNNLLQKNQLANLPVDPSFTSAVLPDATYLITLVSGTGNYLSPPPNGNGNGFFDNAGLGLDGSNNGTTTNYTASFTTNFQSTATPVLSIPDFARGPDSNTPITVPALGFGIPLTLYNAANVTDVTFSLTYNASLLNITGTRSGPNSDATDSAATITLVSNAGGVATFHYTDTNPKSATPDSPLVLGDITGVVPSGVGAAALSLYQVKELLQLGSIVINQGAITGALGSNGIHVNAYAADVNGDKVIDGLDKLAANTVATGAGTGFSAFAQMDPVIVGDIGGDLSVDANDVSTIDAYVAQLNPLQIPQPPTQLLKTNPNYVDPTTIHSPSAADPTLSLVTRGLSALGSPFVSVMIDHPHPEGSTGLTSASLALTYDPTALAVTPEDITLGTITSQATGWQLITAVDPSSGQIGIELYSLTPITATQAGTLVNIAFHIVSGERRGVSPPVLSPTTVQLVDTVTPNGQWFGTGLADAQGGLILSPGVDHLVLPTGSVFVSLAISTSPGVAETTSQANRQLSEDALAQNDSKETSGTTSLLVGFEGGDETSYSILGNGVAGGETGHIISVSAVVTGALAFQTNMATQPLGQTFQIGNLTLFNMLLYRNSPVQLATERLFLALARSAEVPANLGMVDPSFSNLIWDTVPALDWLTCPNLSPAVETEKYPFTEIPDQQATDHNEVSHSAVVDKVFDDLANEWDDIGDLGDY